MIHDNWLNNLKFVVKKKITLFILIITLFAADLVLAEEATEEEILRLRDEVTEREVRIEQINEQIKRYDALVAEKAAEIDSLQNEVAIIENGILKAELDLQKTKLRIDSVDRETRLLDLEIAKTNAELERQRLSLKVSIRDVWQNRDFNPLQIIFSNRTAAEMLQEWQRAEALRNQLVLILEKTREEREVLEEKREQKEEKRLALKELQDELIGRNYQLEAQQSAKGVLIAAAEDNEEEYRELVEKLKEEQEFVQQELQAIQEAIEKKITDADLFGDVTLMSYPVEDFILTTRFRDPTYPFRYLFEHSGLDMAVPQGTPVKSAAPGYVAFARTGRLYGNYIMIVHGNGLATLYAHLSQINVATDEFVGRGEVIGLSGGRPGTPGAGFSTGPHLHFEVRVNGIPVDPIGYLFD